MINETDLLRGGIYAIVQRDTGMFYIGSAKQFKQRWENHIKALRVNKHHSSRMQRIYNKHGKDAFVFLAIEYVDDLEALVEREQEWIDKSGCCDRSIGFNTCRTAGSRLGMMHTEESKRKMSETKKSKCRKATDEQRKRLSEISKGRIESDETRAKKSKALMGHYVSEETKRKIAEKAKNRRASQELREKFSKQRTGSKNIRAILTESDIPIIRQRIKNGDNCRIIAEDYGVSRSAISSIKRGKNWTQVV